MMEFAWSAYVQDVAGDRDTSDPLGFRAVAVDLARKLVPGLTQRTNLTRGFSLLAYGVSLAQDAKNLSPEQRNERFLRFERLWVAAQVWHNGAEQAPFAGKRKAAALLLAGDPYPLGEPILAHQLSAGLWGQYRKACVHFALLKPAGAFARPASMALTPQGKKLAEAFREQAIVKFAKLAVHLQKETIRRNDLKDIIEPDGDKPGDEEREILTEQMKKADISHDGALANLRKIFDGQKGEPLDLPGLKKQEECLNPAQRMTLDEALAVDALMDAWEKSFRKWVTGGSGVTPGSADEKNKEEEKERWKLLQNHPEMARLDRAIGNAAPKGEDKVFRAIHGHHGELARRRGSEPWEIGLPDPARERYTPYDFCLGAVSSLFAEGVMKT